VAAIGEEKYIMEGGYEPCLSQAGFLKRTPRGRVATELAYEHFGRNAVSPKGSSSKNQPSLF